MPYTTNVAGTAITAAWGNANVRDQVVTPFANSAARTSAITAPVDGMLSTLTDTGVLDQYNGAWVTVANAGSPTAYTPAWTTTGTAPSLGNGTLTGAAYTFGKLRVFRIAFTAGSTTTFGTGTWSFSLPAQSAHSFVALGRIVDAGPGTWYPLQAVNDALASTVTLTHTNMTAVTATVPFTWATGDQIQVTGSMWVA